MEFRKTLALRGPNVWARSSALEVWVDLGGLKDTPPRELPGFVERVGAWLPPLAGPCGEVETLAHALGLVVCELSGLADAPAGFGQTRPTSEAGVYRVAFGYQDEEVARACLNSALDLCTAAAHGRPFETGGEVRKLRDLNHAVRLGPSTGAIAAAARKRGIPVRRMNADSLLQLGLGVRQTRVNTAETSRTGAIAESIAQDKELTRALLQQVGVPVPEGRPVEDEDDAWAAAMEIGGPVVVKPRFGNHGRGVTTNLQTREQVVEAFTLASELTSSTVVERFAPGSDFRLLVVGGRLVAAARRDPAQVVGDGTRTVAELVELVNRDPRRSSGHATVLSTIDLCPIAVMTLSEQGLNLHSVPPAGATVVVRRNANLSTGGTATDVTDAVHPEVAARVVDAALAIGLDVAGVDVIATDISRPLEEQGGVIVEVNAGPGLRMHLEPSAGKPRPVGDAIVATLYPEGDSGLIPVVAVTGVNGKTTVTRLVAHMLKLTGKVVGMTCTDGIHIDGRRIEAGDCSGPRSARAVLVNPRVEAAVLETARGGILREGLGFDACDVAVVTNIGEGDHLGLADVGTTEQLARVKRTVVENVAPGGTAVLNADDPLVAAMAPHCPGSVTFFARDGEGPAIAAHLARGGRGVFVRDGVITLADGGRETPLMPVARAAITHHGRVGFQVENVLAATAAAWALGLPFATIAEALLNFSSDPKTTPGRFNVLHHGGASVIVDYGHNPSALLALGDAIAQFPHDRRSIVFSVAGDRRDEDIVRQGAIVGDLFDSVVLYEGECNRGRSDGETVALVRRGLAQGSRVAETVETRGEHKALATALRGLRPGDLLVVQADAVEKTIAFVENFLENRTASAWAETEATVNRLEAVSVVFAD